MSWPVDGDRWPADGHGDCGNWARDGGCEAALTESPASDGDAVLIIDAADPAAPILVAASAGAVAGLNLDPRLVGRSLAGSPLGPALAAGVGPCLAAGRPGVGVLDLPGSRRSWRMQVTPLVQSPPRSLLLLCRLEAPETPTPIPEPQPGFFQIVIDAVPVPIFIKDAAGRYIFCNLAFGEFQGRPAADFIGRTVFEIAPPHLAALYHQADRALLATGGRQIYEAAVRRPDGTDAEVVFYKSVFTSPAGGLGGIIGAILDITDRRDLAKELHAATLAAEQANRMKSQFLVTMSHELRTPLNAVLGFSEVIKDQLCGPVANERYIEYAADIHTCGEHLLSLINDILDLSKIEAGRMALDARELDLRALLGSAIRLIHSRAQTRGVAIRLDLGDPVPELVGDERAIKQILFNLLTNAIKFTPANGTVTVSALHNFAGDVVLCVNDTGIGIPEDQIERIMRPFEQLDNRYAHSEGGTGLGMALVKGLVELHGGRVVIESELGVGTCVSVLLPMPRPPATRG